MSSTSYAVLGATLRRAPFRRSFTTHSSRQSHVGASPIVIPSTVTLDFNPSSEFTSAAVASTSASRLPPPPTRQAQTVKRRLRVTGPKGTLTLSLQPYVDVAVLLSSAGTDGTANSVARVTVHDASIKEQRACWGLSRALLANAVAGVSTSFSLTVRLVGIGYRATLESTTSPTTGQTVQRMNLKLGFGHPVLMPVPADIGVEIPSPTTILLTGIDRQRLGEFAARIRSWRVPEPYKGKGIFVGEETVRRKEVRSK